MSKALKVDNLSATIVLMKLAVIVPGKRRDLGTFRTPMRNGPNWYLGSDRKVLVPAFIACVRTVMTSSR